MKPPVETKSVQISARVSQKLARVLQEDAEMHGRTVSDQLRIALELLGHLNTLAIVRDPEVQAVIERDGGNPAEYEAGIVDQVQAGFLACYGLLFPEEFLTLRP